MKKRFFITSVLMTLVLLVAISTATFAWYTATQTATAKAVSISAAATSEGNSVLISTDHSDWKSEINLVDATSTDTSVGQVIAAPSKALAATYSDGNTWVNMLLEGQDKVAKKTQTAVAPVVLTFYLRNANETNATEGVKAKITFTVQNQVNANEFCFAIYENGELKANSAYNVARAENTDKDQAGASNGATNAASFEISQLGKWEGTNYNTYVVLLWANGEVINDTYTASVLAQLSASFSVVFEK